MGFGIDKDGNPFYRFDLPIINYNVSETVVDATGHKVGSRIVTKEVVQPSRDQLPEWCGWQKTVTFEDIVLLDVANPTEHYKLEKQLFHRVYEISAEKYYEYHKCDFCEHKGYGAKYHFLRSIHAGVFHVCWCIATRFHRTASGPIQIIGDREGHASPWCKLLSEKKIDKQEATAILTRLQRKPNIDVALYLEGADM
jgi:hypothetical protein